MWKYCLFVSALTISTVCGDILSDYAASASDQISYYHYPAPPKSQQIVQPPAQVHQYQQQSSAPGVQTYQNQYQYHNVQQQPQQQRTYQYQQQQQQQQQQSRFYTPSSSNTGYYRSATQSTANSFPASVVNQRFSSPALDNAAFSMALTKQGYTTIGNTAGVSQKTGLAASASSPTSALSSTASTSSNLATTPAQLALLSATPASSANSLNVKLPLPFNITPLNIAPLPLQAGTPYSSLPKAVTSYGTVYPQRKRR